MSLWKWMTPAFVVALSAVGTTSVARAEEPANPDESLSSEDVGEADGALTSVEEDDWTWRFRDNWRYRYDWRNRGFGSCNAMCDDLRDACFLSRRWRGGYNYRMTRSCDRQFYTCLEACRVGRWRLW